MAGVAVAMETALEATARRDTVRAWRFRDSNGSDSAQVHAPGACWPCPRLAWTARQPIMHFTSPSWSSKCVRWGVDSPEVLQKSTGPL